MHDDNALQVYKIILSQSKRLILQTSHKTTRLDFHLFNIRFLSDYISNKINCKRKLLTPTTKSTNNTSFAFKTDSRTLFINYNSKRCLTKQQVKLSPTLDMFPMIFSPRFVRQYLSNGTTKHMHLSTGTLNSMDFLWCQPQVMGTSVAARRQLCGHWY